MSLHIDKKNVGERVENAIIGLMLGIIVNMLLSCIIDCVHGVTRFIMYNVQVLCVLLPTHEYYEEDLLYCQILISHSGSPQLLSMHGPSLLTL